MIGDIAVGFFLTNIFMLEYNINIVFSQYMIRNIKEEMLAAMIRRKVRNE